MTSPKRKRDLINTLHHIERFHQRRSAFVVHTVLSVAFQLALWGNWFASYAVYGRGFEGNFFADRLIVSVVLLVVLAGHFAWMRLMESKDRHVMQAIAQYETAEEHDYHQHDYHDAARLRDNMRDDDDENNDEDDDMAHRRNHRVSSPKT